MADDDYRCNATDRSTTSGTALVQIASMVDGVASRTVPKNSTVTVTRTGTPPRTLTLHFHKAGTAATDYSIVRTVTTGSNGKWSRPYVASVDYRFK